MKRYVLIVAGGRGLRMGGDLPKQFIPMEGKPVLMRTLEAFHRWDASAGLILVLPEDHQPYWEMLCREIGCKVPHWVANGGETRFHSVRNGLHFLSDEIGNAVGKDERYWWAYMTEYGPLSCRKWLSNVLPRLESPGLLSRSCLWSIRFESFQVSRAVRSTVRAIRRCRPRRFLSMICF